MVKSAKKAYEEYPTVVNEVAESSTSYCNTMEDYARMDILMQNAQKAIGGSSDSAQLAQSYMWNKIYKNEYDEEYKQLYDNVIVLAVLAQLAIDGCKKIFEIDVNDEIKRIRAQKCMNKEKDFPRFMAYTHKIPVTKNGKDRPYEEIQADRKKVNNRIDESIVCPMNWVLDNLNKIQGISKTNTTDTLSFLIPTPKKSATKTQMDKIRNLVEEYDAFCKRSLAVNGDVEENEVNLLKDKSEEVFEIVRNINMNIATMHRLISTSFGYVGAVRKDRVYTKATKFTTRMLTVLYNSKKELFLSCFIRENPK